MSSMPGRTEPDGWAAALAGGLAASVAVAASELIAGLFAGAPSLVIAIGTLVIDLQPPGAKDAVVALFGTNDKLALNVVIVVVAIAIAAAAGIAAARRFAAGAAVFVLFGAIAAFGAAREPLTSGAAAIACATISVALGLTALWFLLRIAPRGSVRSPAIPTARDGAVAAIPEGASAAPAATETAAPSASPAATETATPSASPASAAAPPGIRSDESPEWTRRRFLIASAATVGGAVVAGGLGRALLDAQHVEGVVSTSRLPAAMQPVPPLTADQVLRVPGITPLVVPNETFYRIDTALLVPEVDVTTWRLQVKGMVDHPLTFTYDDLLAMPLYEQYVTIACVSNDVGGHLVGNALWTGVRLKDVLGAAGVQPGATQVVGRSVDDFTVGFPTSWAMAAEREPLIAVGMDRQPLPAAHGFPARLIVPGLYGYVSATKWLSSIELTTREAVDGYWVPLGWAKDAPILTQSRIDVPASGQQLPAGPTQVAGVAWAPDRGITGVEVRIDDGDWHAATISRPISSATWVQWTMSWTATQGSHTIEVRAIDGSGTVQTAQMTPPAPDGARGHHRITVQVG